MDGTKQVFAAAILAGAVSGSGGGVITNKVFDPAPDRFTGAEGKVHDARLSALESNCQELRAIVRDLPPNWFEADVQEMRDELKLLRQTNDDMKIQLIQIKHMLSGLQVRGHVSPNDLVMPGIFGTKGEEK